MSFMTGKGRKIPVAECNSSIALLVKPYLVESNNKGRLAHLKQIDGLYGLLLQAMHHVHNQDGNVTQARSPGPQIGEGLVPCSAAYSI